MICTLDPLSPEGFDPGDRQVEAPTCVGRTLPELGGLPTFWQDCERFGGGEGGRGGTHSDQGEAVYPAGASRRGHLALNFADPTLHGLCIEQCFPASRPARRVRASLESSLRVQCELC